MSKRKITPFAPWETTKPDGKEGRYIRMGDSQMLHPALFSLSHSAFRVYTYMKLESGGNRDFTFPRCKWRKYLSPGGFQLAIRQLCQAGLVEVLEQNKNLRKANVYRFSEKWKSPY